MLVKKRGVEKLISGIFVISATSLGVLAILYGQNIEASIDREGIAKQCSPSNPIAVRVQNRSLRTIKQVHFRMELFKGNRSRNMLADSSYVFDNLVKPFNSRILCFSDEYTDHLIGIRNHQEEGSESVNFSVSSAISEVDAARAFVSSHSVYISDVRYVLLD